MTTVDEAFQSAERPLMATTAFDYLYRDASNYKIAGTVLLAGAVSTEENRLVEERLHEGEMFIAEQVLLPSLQAQLAAEFGSSPDDHCWHTFVGWRQADASEGGGSATKGMTVAKLVNNFRTVIRLD